MGKKRKILVVDDDPAIVEVIELMLTEVGYYVEGKTNTFKIQELMSDLPDLILLDIWMSGVDGRDLCKEMKKDVKLKEIPIVLVSASRDIEASAQSAGADGFLAKPFEMDNLLKVVSQNLGE